MNQNIKNKIDEAGLVTLDLKIFEVQGERMCIDLADWLDNEFIIKEASFKEKIEKYNWSKMQDAFVAVFCSKDVIIPPWSYLLIQTKLITIARQVFFSDIHTMNLLLFQKKLDELNLKEYKNKRVFLKVCSGSPVPLGGLSLCVNKLIPCVKSLFYGEPCSSIPLIKN
ncbi:MAG: hypothetical protein CMP49_00540 [Flavobacteriales bacterium]|jgi:hypothetical protein|nr:hypothetical protein [Flavobacteriales bacterium]|tara:strand:+ start:34722 stop:35225 length:504 start_codon:yes stop_codon:yes gene_type:complete